MADLTRARLDALRHSGTVCRCGQLLLMLPRSGGRVWWAECDPVGLVQGYTAGMPHPVKADGHGVPSRAADAITGQHERRIDRGLT